MAESSESQPVSIIEKYLAVVSKRKSIDRKQRTVQVNYAILSQLEEKDIPLLIEIIKVQSRALEAVIELGEDVDGGQVLTQPLEEIVVGLCANAYVKSSELAELGNTKRWGGATDEYAH